MVPQPAFQGPCISLPTAMQTLFGFLWLKSSVQGGMHVTPAADAISTSYWHKMSNTNINYKLRHARHANATLAAGFGHNNNETKLLSIT